MLGPKPFALDRMMAIFYSIVEGRVAPTANIFMQVYIVELSFSLTEIKKKKLKKTYKQWISPF